MQHVAWAEEFTGSSTWFDVGTTLPTNWYYTNSSLCMI